MITAGDGSDLHVLVVEGQGARSEALEGVVGAARDLPTLGLQLEVEDESLEIEGSIGTGVASGVGGEQRRGAGTGPPINGGYRAGDGRGGEAMYNTPPSGLEISWEMPSSRNFPGHHPGKVL